MPYQPPFQLTNTMLHLVADIGVLVGEWNANQQQQVPFLRRGNRLKTIQASLAIEQNTLSLEQVTAVLDGKVVLGLPKEIQEVKNAFAAYEKLSSWQSPSLEHFLAAHRQLMSGLANDAGQLRSGGVGIYRGTALVHMAPPATQLPRLMQQLFSWLGTTDFHPLIRSCAFHYELEFIHPFSDGNGRMGRLWQTLLLSEWQPLLAYLPVETVIRHRQELYYESLSEADQTSDCTTFIEFMLTAIKDSLREGIATQLSVNSDKTRVETKVKTRVKTPDAVLALLANNSKLSLREVSVQLGKSLSAIERAASKLQAEGYLKFEGPKKEGRWIVKP
jgi:Fic family protein